MPEGSDKGYKVVDRRGGHAEEVSDSKSGASGTGPGVPVQGQVQKVGPAPAGSTGGAVLGQIDFGTFLVSLASSALIHLGDAPHPETGKADISLPHAQQTIDLLELLQEKTAGNLSDEEGKLLQALLRDLRLRFVQATRSPPVASSGSL